LAIKNRLTRQIYLSIGYRSDTDITYHRKAGRYLMLS